MSKKNNYPGKLSLILVLGLLVLYVPIARAQCGVNCPAPTIVLNTSSLSFVTPPSGVPSPQTFSISTPGSILGWTIRVSTTGGGWLTATPTAGVGDTTVTVSVNSALLRPGTYTGNLSVVSSGASNSPQNLTVTLVVAIVNLTVSPASLVFAGSPGLTPLAQQLNIASGGVPIQWTASVSTTTSSSLGTWLSVSPVSGTTPAVPSISVNTAGLAPGTYQGSITVSSESASNKSQTVNVTLGVGTPVIGFKPSQLVFGVNAGSSVSPQPVQITNTGSGILGWSAFATVNSGGNWLTVSPATSTAPSTLAVAVNSNGLAAGIYTGSVTISAITGINAANSPQVLPVTFAVDVPAVQPGGIVNGASFSTDAVLSAGAIASLFGVNLASTTASATAQSSPVILPTTLADTQVLVNGTPAPLFFVSPKQINFQMPAGMQESNVQVVVVSKEVRGVTTDVKLEPQAPGIFFASTGQGIVLNQDFSLNSSRNPAAAASVIMVFATGLGATDPPVLSGQGAGNSPVSVTVDKPVVTIGGTAAEVLFSGLAPGFVGLYQLNVRVPSSTAQSNTVPLQIQSGTRTSNTVTIAVR